MRRQLSPRTVLSAWVLRSIVSSVTVLVRDLSLGSQRGVLALITIRARIGVHGIPTGIFRGGFMHGSKLTLLILDLVF